MEAHKNEHYQSLEALSSKIHILLERVESDPRLTVLKRRNPFVTGVLERAHRFTETTELRTLGEVRATVREYERALRELERIVDILRDLQAKRAATEGS